MIGESAEGAPRRRGAKAYLGATFVAQFCALARYTLLARLLGPEQLGIAVALILASQFFEAITDSGSDRFLVQDKHGDTPEVGKLVHLVWLMRGLVIGGLLIILAVPLANFFGAKELKAAFPILALAPIIAGFTHLDFRRMQRRSDFHGESRVLILSEVVSLVATGIAAILTRDFTAILYGLIARSLIIMIVSWRVAERPYRVGFDKEHAHRLSAFALPLMLNGLLLFLGSQGDRLLIGKQVGLAELGHYSAAMLLIFYPTGMVQRYMTTMHLPLLAGAAEGEPKHRAADRLAGQTLVLTILMVGGFAAIAPWVIPLLYGAQFKQPAFIIAAIGVLQAGRFIRLWPVTIALSQGRSRTVLASNVTRLLAFPAAIVAGTLSWGLFGILIAFTLAEILSLIVTSFLASRHLSAPFTRSLMRIAAFIAFCALVLAWAAAAEAPTIQSVGALATFTIAVAVWVCVLEWQTMRDAKRLLVAGRRS